MRISYSKVEDARVPVKGSETNGTVYDLSSAKCKDYCSKTWWCDILNYDRKKSECTLMRKKITTLDIEMDDEIEFDLYIRSTSTDGRRELGSGSAGPEETAAANMLQTIKEGKAAEKVMQKA